ncbi:MAG: hypothetical protein ACLUUG_07125 [Lachnospiraceae bacterium]
MQDYEQSILEQYNLEVNSTRKTRGAILCDAKQGGVPFKRGADVREPTFGIV